MNNQKEEIDEIDQSIFHKVIEAILERKRKFDGANFKALRKCVSAAGKFFPIISRSPFCISSIAPFWARSLAVWSI